MPSLVWLNRLMDASQGGNPAAVAGQAVCLALVSRFTGARSPYLLGRRAAAGYIACEFVQCRTGGTAYVTRPRSH